MNRCALLNRLLTVSCASAVAVAAYSFIGAAHAAGAIAVRDAREHEFRRARPPERIVSLLPPLTEIVCALDQCDRLVGADRFSNWPAQIAALPKAGGLDDPQVEVIVSLRPDVVLLGRASRVTGRLEELGVETFVLDARAFPDIARNVTAIAALLGIPDRGAALNRRIDEEVTAVRDGSTVSRHDPGPSVYFEVDRGPYAAGPESFIGELLTRLGARNIVTADLGPFPRLNPEYVVQKNPDVIFVSLTEAGSLSDRPGWNRIRAVREHRVCSFPPEVSDTMVRAGPRVAQGMRAMAECLDRVAP